MVGARDDIVEPGVMEAVVRAVERIRHRAPVDGSLGLSRPIGPLLDLRAAWSGTPAFDAHAITTPTLVVRGALDRFADPGLAGRLRPTALVEHVIDDATHWLMYERRRERLFDLAARFIHHG
jgi:pimeloyl-ACP methyl ester carboxylesterase